MDNFNGYNVIEKLDSGASSVKKYMLEKDNKHYLLRLYDIRFMKDRLEAFENIDTLYNNDISVPRIYEFGTYDSQYGYAIIEWIDGVSLDKVLTSNSLTLNYAQEAARELLKMHEIEVTDIVDIYECYINSFTKKLKKINNLTVDYDFDPIKSFVLSNASALKNLDISVIHGDFHPGNIILNNEKITFIDMDVCQKNFAWIDLSTNACNMDFPEFYTILINEYFDGNIPHDFWLIYNLYGSLYCLDYILYCNWIGNKQISDGVNITRQFLEYTNTFNSLKPNWYNDKILRKGNENGKFKKV